MNRIKSILATVGLLGVSAVAFAAGQVIKTDTQTYVVNDDDATVTLVDVSANRHSQKVDVNLAAKVGDEMPERKYTITGVGDGTNNLALWVKPPLRITPNIERINDNALSFIDYIPMQVDLVMCNSRNLRYLGNDCATAIDTLWLYNTMTIGETGAKVGHLEFCETVPVAADPAKALFRSVGSINCRESTPPDVNFTLASDADLFNIIVTVPDNAKEAYLKHAYWKQFHNLRTVSEHRQLLAEEEARRITVATPDGNGTATYAINPDNATVTLISVTATDATPPRVDLWLPVTDSRTGKVYTVSEIGDGTNAVGSTQGVIISPAIKRINAHSSLRITSLPEWNEVQYIGPGAFDFSFLTDELYLAPGAVCAMRPWMLMGRTHHYFRIADGVRLASDGAPVFGAPVRIIRCDSPTPPVVEAPLYSLSESYESSNTMLLVPAGSLNTYRSHPEWGKIEDIFEFTDDLPLLPYDDYDPSAGSEFTITDSGDTYTIRVSPDGHYVTLIDYVPASSVFTSDYVEFSNPLTDPATGTSYTINVIGFDKEKPAYLKITDNIIRINDKSLQGLCNVSIPNTNNLMYVGSETFFSDLNTVDELYLGDGAVMKSGNNFPDKVELGNVSSIGETGKCVFSIRSYPTPPWKQVIECTSAVPPIVYGTLYHPMQDNLYTTTTLIVPRGCTGIYSNAYEWGRMANIIESDNNDMSDIADTTLPGSRLQVRASAGGIVITTPCDTQVKVITVDGLLMLSRQLPAGETFVQLPAGFFIVTDSTGISAKVLVR